MLRPNTIGLTILLGLLTAFGPLSTDMYIPSMPAVGRLLGASTAEVQLTLSSYLMGFAVGQIVYGPASDRRAGVH
jgi:MFS transporter, DHA1 family, multidrug resistance protein